jgi:DNA-binding response OmpR family regulator
MNRKVKILVVEDERMLLKTLQFKLDREGYDVLIAEDGKTAMNLIESEKPDLVVSDVMLPYASGMEIVTFTKQVKDKNIPILLLTTLRQEKNVLRAFELGADEFMTKPFSPNELTIRIKRLLGRYYPNGVGA